MTKEVAKKESTEVAAPSVDAWGPPPEVSAKDTIISKILPMQGMSKKVMDGEAAFGEIRDSVTNELVGNLKDPVSFVPFYLQAVWVESEMENGKWVYRRTYPITHENDNQKYEEGSVKRVRTLNFFVCLEKDLAAGLPIPKILSFRVTSLRAGRKLQTQMYTANQMAKKSPAAMTMKLVAQKQQNDKGTFVVLDVEPAGETSPRYEALVFDVYKALVGQLKQGTLKVDESDVADDAIDVESEAAPPSNSQF